MANSLDSMGCIIGQGMNLAMITVIGQCVGAGDLAQVRYYTKKLLLVTYAATAVTNSLILLFLHPILGLYGLGAEATELAYILVMIHDGLLSRLLATPLAAICAVPKPAMMLTTITRPSWKMPFSMPLGIPI